MSTPDIEIREARIPLELDLVRLLFREYAASLGVDLSFQGFESELAELPGSYTRPAGGLWVAMNGIAPAGCVAMRPHDSATAEMKRLYVRPTFRGQGLSRRLINQVLTAARNSGYQRICLDTLPSMADAIRMYRQMDFVPIEPYYNNPVSGAIFLEKELEGD